MQIDKNVFKGIAKITLYDIQEDGFLKEQFTYVQENKILINVIELLLNRTRVFSPEQDGYRWIGFNAADLGHKIAILNNEETEKFSRRQGNYLAIGDPSLISDNYIKTLASNTEPANVVYQNRFLAPSQDRTFYSLGIAKNTYPIIESDGSDVVDLFTYILLNTPITQTTNQTLDISYKVFIDWDASTTEVNYNGQRDIEKLFLGDTINEPQENYDIGLEKNQFIHGVIVDDPGVHLYNDSFGWNDTQRTQILGFLPRFADTFSLTDRYGATGKPFIGSFARGLQYGGFRKHNPTLPSYIGREYFNKTSNLSSVYSHSVGADVPMYDGNKLANSSWQPVITDNNTTKEFPSQYILKVSKAGGLGVGEYKVYKTGWGGWSGNRYSYSIGCPFLNFDLSLYYNEKDNPDYSVTTNFDCYNHRWNYTWSYTNNEHYFVSYVRNVGVALHKLTSESLEVIKKYKLTDYHAMNFYIEDIEVLPQDNLIYVATKGGLFKIDTSTDTVTQENTDRCVSVVTGYQNKVFAVFITQNGTDINGNPTYTGRVSNSDDYTVALNNGTTLAPTDLPTYENTWRLYINKESTDYEMMLIVGIEPKGKWREVGFGNQFLYDIYWRNNSEYVKKERITMLSNGSYANYSDLMCFPSNNTVVCDNNIWVYPSAKYYTNNWHQVRYQFDFNHGEDIKQDFIDNNWNTRESNYYSWAGIKYINDDPNAYLFPTTTGSNRLVVCGTRINISRFAGNPLRQFNTFMDGVGDVFKGYESEGNQYKITLLMETWVKPTSPHYDPNANTGTIIGREEGQDLETVWTTNSVGAANRLSYLVNIDLDLDTDTVNVGVRGGSESVPRDALRSQTHPDFGSLRRTSEKQIIVFPKVGTVSSRGFYMLSPFKYPDRDLKENLIQAYSWNGTEWETDNNNTGPGRPLHTNVETIVNGLSVNWKELNAGDSQDLVLDQYYTFTRTTADNMIPIEAHTPDFTFYYWWSFRRRVEATHTVVIPSNREIFVPEAPAGSSPDPEWKGLTLATELLLTVELDGTNVPIIDSINNVFPPAGTVNSYRDIGRFRFNTADVGKTAVINYTYYLKYDESEE